MPRHADVQRFTITDPGNVTAVAQAMDGGRLRADQIVAVIGKTPGNGLVNDYTRGYLTQSLALAIAERTGESIADVTGRVPFVFSGGVEGVLCPHITVFTVQSDGGGTGGDGGGTGPALAVGTAMTRALGVSEIGGNGQIEATREAVLSAMTQAEIEPQDVHYVQIKGPAPTPEAIGEAYAGAPSKAAPSAETLMARGRAACSFGVMQALGEQGHELAVEAAILTRREVHSRVASTSAGIEVAGNEVVVLGNSGAWGGPFKIDHRTMADALDISAVVDCCAALDLSPAPQVGKDQSERLAAVFVKCEADRSGKIRGLPHTMLADGDINRERHIRAAVGALVAAVTGDTRLFVSGGAEHQGPDGGGLVAMIARR